MRKNVSLALALTGSLLVSASAFAGTITYSVTNGGPGSNDSGTAVFVWDNTTHVLDITMTDTSTITGIANVLDGLTFTNSGGSGFTLTSVTPTGVEDCTSGTCTPTTGTSPYGWTIGAGSGSEELFAGGGSLHPYGIVNSGMNASLDGLSNHQHNPYLLGPVMFALSYTGSISGITGADFYFGTGPDIVPGGGGGGGDGQTPVPEPASLLLLGSGLAFAARRLRRNGAAAA